MLKKIGMTLAALAFPVLAQAEDGSLVLSVAGVVNDRVEEVRNDEENDAVNYGGGVLVEAAVNDHFGIETGVLVIKRQYDLNEDDVRVVQEVSRLHVPILARFWATDFLSIAAGPYVAFKTGDTETSLEIGDNELGSIETSADDDVEYGLDAALTLNFAVADKSGLFIEGRYSNPMSNDDDEDADQVSGLVGLKFDI